MKEFGGGEIRTSWQETLKIQIKLATSCNKNEQQQDAKGIAELKTKWMKGTWKTLGECIRFPKFKRRLCTQLWCFILGDGMSECKTDIVWCGATLDEIRNGSASCLPPVMPSNSHSVFFQVIYILRYILCLVWKCEKKKKAWNYCFYSCEKFVFFFPLNKTIAIVSLPEGPAASV